MTSVLLTRVASLLVRRRVLVYCHHPPGIPWGDALGITTTPPDEIFLRYCPCTRRRWPLCVLVFAHELIHVEHPRWREWRVRRWDDWYARVVVAPAIRRGGVHA